MKKRFMFLLVLMLLALPLSALASIYGTYNGYPVAGVSIDGKAASSDVPAIIMDGRILVPLRLVAESMGAQVAWNSDSYTVSVSSPIASTKGEKELYHAGILGFATQHFMVKAINEESATTITANKKWKLLYALFQLEHAQSFLLDSKFPDNLQPFRLDALYWLGASKNTSWKVWELWQVYESGQTQEAQKKNSELRELNDHVNRFAENSIFFKWYDNNMNRLSSSYGVSESDLGSDQDFYRWLDNNINKIGKLPPSQ